MQIETKRSPRSAGYVQCTLCSAGELGIDQIAAAAAHLEVVYSSFLLAIIKRDRYV